MEGTIVEIDSFNRVYQVIITNCAIASHCGEYEKKKTTK
jgi:hypothetical protein